MILRCIAESAIEPLTLDEVKLHCRLSTSDTTEDSLLTGLIKGIRQQGENITKRAFVPHTYQLSLDEFPDDGITLPISPLSTLAVNITVSYVDTAGANQTLSATAYSVDDRSEPGYLTPSSDNEWPDTYDQINAVTIQYVSGYPLNGTVATTPDAIKAWMKLRVGTLYEHREAIALYPGQNVIEMPRTFVDGLLDPYCLPEV